MPTNILARLVTHFTNNPDNMREIYDEGGNIIDIFLATPIRIWSVFGRPSLAKFMGHHEKLPVGGIATVSLYPILGAIGFLLAFKRADAKATSLREINTLQRICKAILADNPSKEEKENTEYFLNKLNTLEHLKNSIAELKKKITVIETKLDDLYKQRIGTSAPVCQALINEKVRHELKIAHLEKTATQIKEEDRFNNYFNIKADDIEKILHNQVRVDRETGKVNLATDQQKNAVYAKFTEKENKKNEVSSFRKYILNPIDFAADIYFKYSFDFWIIFSAVLFLRGTAGGFVPTIIQLVPSVAVPLTYLTWKAKRFFSSLFARTPEEAQQEEQIKRDTAEAMEVAKLLTQYLIITDKQNALLKLKKNTSGLNIQGDKKERFASALGTRNYAGANATSTGAGADDIPVDHFDDAFETPDNDNAIQLQSLINGKEKKNPTKAKSDSPIGDYFGLFGWKPKCKTLPPISFASASRGMSYYLRLEFMIWLASTQIAAIAKYFPPTNNPELVKDIEERQIMATWTIIISAIGLGFGMVRGAIETRMEQNSIRTRAEEELEKQIIDARTGTTTKGKRIDALVKAIEEKLLVIKDKKQAIESLLKEHATDKMRAQKEIYIPSINIDPKFETFIKKYLGDNSWLTWFFNYPYQLVNDIGNLIFLYRTIDVNWWNLLASSTTNIAWTAVMLPLWPIRILHRVFSAITKEKETLLENLDQLIVYLEAELEKAEQYTATLEQNEKKLLGIFNRLNKPISSSSPNSEHPLILLAPNSPSSTRSSVTLGTDSSYSSGRRLDFDDDLEDIEANYATTDEASDTTMYTSSQHRII